MEKTGVQYINWPSHPTFNNLYAFVLQIKPKRIISIYTEFPEIPEIIQDLCEVDDYDDELCKSMDECSNRIGWNLDSSDDSDDSDDSPIVMHNLLVPQNEIAQISTSLSSSESVVTIIFNPSQTPELPVAQSTPNNFPSNILLKRKQNILENCKKKISRNFPQTKLLENRGVNYLD